MNAELLIDAIGRIDDTKIAAAKAVPPPSATRPLLWMRWVAVAACAAVIVAAGFWATWQPSSPPPVTESPAIVFPADNDRFEHLSTSMLIEGLHYYSFAELAAMADTVVCADVAEHYTRPYPSDDKGLNLYATVSVVEVLKGDVTVGDTLCVVDNGSGRIDDNGHTILSEYGGGLRLQKGNRVLLFLQNKHTLSDDGWPKYGFVQQQLRYLGKFFLDADGKYHASLSYDEDGRRFSPYPPDDLPPLTLDEIREAIAADPDAVHDLTNCDCSDR